MPKLISANQRCRDPAADDQEEEGDTVADDSEPNGDEPGTSTLDALSADRRRKREVLAAQGIGLVDLIAKGYRFIAWIMIVIFILPIIVVSCTRPRPVPSV